MAIYFNNVLVEVLVERGPKLWDLHIIQQIQDDV